MAVSLTTDTVLASSFVCCSNDADLRVDFRAVFRVDLRTVLRTAIKCQVWFSVNSTLYSWQTLKLTSNSHLFRCDVHHVVWKMHLSIVHVMISLGLVNLFAIKALETYRFLFWMLRLHVPTNVFFCSKSLTTNFTFERLLLDEHNLHWWDFHFCNKRINTNGIFVC